MIRSTLYKACLFLGASLVAGCASKPPEVIDNTPLLRAAKVTSNYSTTGFKGFLASKGTQDSYTFPNMRVTKRTSKFTGSIMSRVSGSQSTSDIVRMDKGVEWQSDNKKKTYYECAIGKCTGIGNNLSAALDTEQEGEFEEDDDLPPGCVITVQDQRFDVAKTGQKREVNGFPAEEYTIDWRYIARDDVGGKLENIFGITIWTTPQTAAMTEALNVHDEFGARYTKALNDGYPDAFTNAMPRNALKMLERFFLDALSDSDLRKLKGMMADNIAIEGFPVSNKIKWDARDTTCAAPKEPETEEEKGRLNTGSIKGLLGSVAKQVVKQEVDKKAEEKAREIALAPIFVYIVDVTAVEMDEVRESQLSVPANYQLLTRK